MSDFKVVPKLQWNGSQAISSLDTAQREALIKSSILVEEAAVRNVNTQVYNTPESPDYRRTGALRASISRVVGAVQAFVGSALDYSIYVEKGTRFVKARPFLLPALILNKDKIIAIFKKENKESKYVK
jgi:HK97 gp10 family phage protein